MTSAKKSKLRLDNSNSQNRRVNEQTRLMKINNFPS